MTVVEGEDKNGTCIGELRHCHFDTTQFIHLHATMISHMPTNSAMHELTPYFIMILQIVWRTEKCALVSPTTQLYHFNTVTEANHLKMLTKTVYCSLDINECKSGVAECSEVCVNTEGSFHCSCYDPGYKLAEDGVNCTGTST